MPEGSTAKLGRVRQLQVAQVAVGMHLEQIQSSSHWLHTRINVFINSAQVRGGSLAEQSHRRSVTLHFSPCEVSFLLHL